MKKSKRGKKRKSDRLQRRLGFIFVPCYHLYIYHYSVFDVFSKRCSDIFNSAFFFFLFVSNLSIPRLSQLPKDSDSSKASCRMKRGKDPKIRLKNWRGSPRRPASTSVGSAPPLFLLFQQPRPSSIESTLQLILHRKHFIPQHKEMRRNTAGGAKKIALSAVKTLTFYADKYTAGRRTNPIREFFTEPRCD